MNRYTDHEITWTEEPGAKAVYVVVEKELPHFSSVKICNGQVIVDLAESGTILGIGIYGLADV